LQTGGSKTELAQRNSHWSAGNPKAHGPKPHAAIQAKFNDHPAKHYIPINVSPLGTDALFVGKGDGEGVSVKANTQQLSIVGNKEKMMEAHMDMNQCKAWGKNMAKRRFLHMEDKVGTPKDRRIALHCGALFKSRMSQTKMDIAIKERHIKARKAAEKAAADAKAPQAAAADAKAAAVEVAAALPEQKQAVMQAKKMVTKAAWWKNPHYGFHFKKSVAKVAKVQGMKHAANKDMSKTQDLNAFKKLGLA